MRAAALNYLPITNFAGLEGVTRQVEEMEDQQVVDAIECKMISTVLSIMGGQGASLAHVRGC